MIGWIIVGSIIFLIAFLLFQSVTVTAVYDKKPEVTVKYMFFTILKIPSPPKKKKRKKKKDKPVEKPVQAAAENTEDKVSEAEGTATEKENGSTEAKEEKPPEKTKPQKKKKSGFKLSDIDLEMIKDYVESASPPIKRLFKKIRVRDIYIDYVVGSDDAAKTAIKYGSICAVVYSTIKWLTTYFNVKAKEVNVEADFKAEKDDIFAYGKVKLRVSTAVGCALWLAVRVLKTYMKYNKNVSAHRA